MTSSVRQQAFSRTIPSLVAGGLVAALLSAFAVTTPAYAETANTSPLSNAGQYSIEALTDAYEEAMNQAAEAAAQVEESYKKIVALEADVGAQQKRTNQAVRDLYIMENERLNLLDAMLNAESLDDMVKYADYIEHVSKVNTDQLNDMKDLLSELETAHAQLEQAQQEAAAQEALAREALLVLQDQRAAKQRGANATDGADWYMSQDEFIDEWAPRIDAYLAGSPMAGTGESFARAAWLNCIDPRWSPAISTIESGKGAKCIRPFNAWGWGAADSDPKNLASEWSSWDEAINAHVKGLAYGYGYTISPGAAAAYCPSNHEHWYETTVSEMAKI